MSCEIADVAAERAVLAGIFNYGSEAYADVADITTSRTFTDESNQTLFRCLEHALKDQPGAEIDYATVLSAAHTLGVSRMFERREEKEYVRSLANFPVRRETVRKLAGKIRKLEITRLLDGQLAEARASLLGVTGDEPLDRILSLAEGPVFDFTSLLTGQSEGPRLMGEGALEYAQYLMDNPREMMGISTGLKMFDFAIGGGLRTNSLDIIAARPKTGKTFLVDNVALHIAGTLGVPVFNLDTEMSWEEHLHRILANLAGVDIRDIETGKCGIKDIPRQRVLEAASRLKDMPYHYECIIGKAFEEVLSSMRRWVTRTVGIDPDTGKAKPCVILYDYLKMMSADFMSADLKEYQALGFITTALKNFMGRYSVPCLCFAQLNRDGIDREDTDVISGSDRIVHYCTSLTLYKRKSDEERAEATAEAQKYTHKLVNLVSRHGEGLLAGDYINVQADYRRGRIVEGPTRNQLFTSGNAGGLQPGGIIVDSAAQETVEFAA